MPTRRALAGLVCLCTACVYNPQFEDGRTRCSTQGECPPGFTCSPDQLCRRPATADANNADTAPPPPDGP
ncbi:MAG TPA: hypothetical protein VN914_09390, partial [Polyangia bacterium]|nr:hypothetical protein [Polyangia bacterium]